MLRLLAVLLSGTTLVAAAGDAPPLTVSAAVSLSDVLQDVAQAYRAAGGGEVRFNFGPSNALARQIANGAPVDLFISADDAQMRIAAASGAIDTTTIVELLSTRLAVVTRRGGRRIAAVSDLEDVSVRRIAVGDPSAVPAGVYARQFLERAGVWDRLRPKLVPVSTARAALAAAANGSADAAIVYETDAARSSDVDVAFVVVGPEAPGISYPAAIPSRAPNRAAAERFLEYLRGSEARATFTRYKFITPRGTEPAVRPTPTTDVWHIIWFTITTAALATGLMLPPGLFLAWLLARRAFRGRVLLETIVSLPLVLPPVATGLVLLMFVSPRGPAGRVLGRAGIDVVFTWKAVVLAMAVMGLPLLVRTSRAAFEQVDRRYEAVAATLGARPLRVFFTITLPLALPGVIAGSVLGFARALGEFGATIMVAGSIPGATRTLAVAIYSFAETGRDADAMRLVAVSAVIAFAALGAANWVAARAGVRS